MDVIALDGRTLTPAGVVAIARRRAQAELAPAARERNAAAGGWWASCWSAATALRRDDRRGLAATPSPTEDPGDHQWRLLRSHAGRRAPLTTEVVRAAMAVRANQIGAGGAGVGDACSTACWARSAPT